MDNCCIKNKINDIIYEHLRCHKREITPDAHLEKDLGADSLDRVEIVMDIEEKFKLDTTFEKMEDYITVQDLYNIVFGELKNEKL